jgi:hypothetical protein
VSIDIEISHSGELMVAQMEGMTEEGIEFVDGYMGTPEMVVVDSGRIVLRASMIEPFVSAAHEAGLVTQERKVL